MSLSERYADLRPGPTSVAVAGCLAGSLLCGVSAQPAPAQGGGPFAPFAGSYRGGGVVVGTNGQRERLSCRDHGAVGDGGQSLSERMVCASDSYRFDIRTHAVAEGGSVRGEWQETTRGASGQFTGRVGPGRFNGSVQGGGFSAQFSLRASGRRQFFVLRPQGADVASVEVTLSR